MQKLVDCYVRLYEVTEQIVPIPYHINLPESMKINNIFSAGLPIPYI